MKKIGFLLFGAMLAAFAFAGCGEPAKDERTLWERYWEDESAYGMSVSEDGTLELLNEPYYGFGMNYFSLFSYTYGANVGAGFDLSDTIKGLDVLAEYKVPVVRFNCGGYGASHSGDSAAYDWVKRYQTDKENYLGALKEIAQLCEERQIGLIPSLFWKQTSIPYHFGETCAAFGDKTSKSYAFIEEYTTDVVNALKDSKAVMGWELGNEWNLETDLEYITQIEDFRKMRYNDYVEVAKLFDKTITKLDGHKRFISSGNAYLRPSQYNQTQGKAERDTWEQHEQAIAIYHPGNFNMVSEHLYDYPNVREYPYTLAEYLKKTVDSCKAQKKVFFFGEFNLPINEQRYVYDGTDTDQLEDLDWAMANMENACNAIIDARVQLTLFWNFDPKDITEGSFCTENVQGTATGKAHAKFGKFLFETCQKLNEETYPAALAAA